MPVQIKREVVSGRYYRVLIHDCPKDAILLAASLGLDNVTVENFSHYYTREDLLEVQIRHEALAIQLSLKQYLLDFTMNSHEFLSLIDIWDQKGCYAVFHRSPIIKFKATDLLLAARYRALDNFGWNLEIAIPSSASDGWGAITSPDESLIQKIVATL